MHDNPCSVGALKRVFESELPPDQVVPNPVFQVLQIKPIAAQPNAPERYRIVFSDTENFIQSMLATQVNHLVVSKELEKGCFVRLNAYQANQVKDKKILIVLGLDVLKEHGRRDKIGNPVSLEQEMARAPSTTSTATLAAESPQQASAASFYKNKPAAAPAPQRAPAQKSTSRPGAAGHDRIYPIESLSPYQNKWTIKARVTSKSEIKTWHNQKGGGKLFTVNFLDESGEIRATGFNDQVDALYDLFQEGQVYYVSKCRVNMAKRQFSNISNDYELAFERDTEVEKCIDVDDGVPQLRFSFVQFADLETIQKDSMIDVIGVVKDVGEVSTITSKATQKPYSKRELTLVDKTNYLVRCTVWGNTAEKWETSPDEIVAFKGVKVSDFGGRTLSTLHSSSITVNPDIDEAHTLRGWYDGQGRGETFQSHQGLSSMSGGGRGGPLKNLAQIKDENLGMGDNPDYFVTKATIVYIKQEGISYPACMSEGCARKVIPVDDKWRCEKCDKTHPKPQHRYIMTISCNDAFGQAWLSCFDEVGRMVMGKSADELYELNDLESSNYDNKAYLDTFTEANCKTYLFRCRAKMDVYENVPRVRYQVMSATPMNYAVEAAKLADQIKLYSMN